MKELVIKVNGMVCTGCESRVQNAIKAVRGVKKVVANHKRRNRYNFSERRNYRGTNERNN